MAEDDCDDRLAGLVCVEYPGVVQSPDNMITTLGGRDTIAQVLEEPNRRLELRCRLRFLYNHFGISNI